MIISEARTGVERQKVKQLLSACIPNIPKSAVPPTQMDAIMAPLVVQVEDPESGEIVGGAPSCRAPLAIAAIASELRGHSTGYEGVINRHSMLDLLGVHPNHRGRMIGKQIITFMEKRLHERGVRAWFGLVEDELEVEELQRFYLRQGFVVLQRGQMLPPLLGKQLWAGSAAASFFFLQVVEKRCTLQRLNR